MKKIIFITGFMLAMVVTAHAQDCATGYCPETLRVEHKAGTVSPVTQTINYSVVETDLSGTTACWITQNLGATAEATAGNSTSVTARGWFWQFNRKQGYYHDGTTRTPSVVNWISSIDEDSDWLAENDPCTLLLGDNWHIPTAAEWTAVSSGWSNYTSTFNSVLKLHAAGRFSEASGSLGYPGEYGFYWSSEQASTGSGSRLVFDVSVVEIGTNVKAVAMPLRCIRTY